MAQDNHAKRNLLIGLGAVGAVLVILYILFTWVFAQDRNADSNSSVRGVNATGAGGRQSSESEYYSSLLENYNQENAQRAQNAGSSYLSVLSAREEQAEPEQEPEPEPQPTQQPVYYPPPPPRQQQQQQAQQRQPSDALMNNVQGMMASWTPGSSQMANTVEWRTEEQISHARNSSEQTGQASAQNQNTTLDHRIIDDYAVLSALLDTEIDTDENSLVVAEVPAGPYAGARFYASGYRRLENTVDMTFTAMRWRGRSYAVNAKPVDIDTNRTALSGDVSSRYWSRIGIPAIARGVARAGQLYEDSSKVTVVSGLGNVVSGSDGRRVSDREVTGAFVGGLADQTANVLEQDASRIPIKQVLVPRHTTIGIQIIGSVNASDELNPDAQGLDLEAASQLAPQPERGQTFQPMGQQQRPTRGAGNVFIPDSGGFQ